MAIRDESLGDLSLNNDIRPEIGIDANQDNVSLGDNNTQLFAAVGDGDTVTGRSMSEMGGEALFSSILPQTEAEGALGESLVYDTNSSSYTSFTPSFDGNRRTWTVSAWVKFNRTGSRETIMSQGSTSVLEVVHMTKHSDDKLRIYIERSGGEVSILGSSLILDTSGWYNIVFAFDATKSYTNDKCRIYVNGIEDTGVTISGGTFTDDDYGFNKANNAIRIGQYRYTNSYYLDGLIADFKFIDGKQLRPDSFGELVQGIWIPKAFNTATGESLVTSNLRANIQFSSDGKFTEEQGNHSISNYSVDIIKNNYGVSHYDNVNDRFILADTDNSNNIFDNGLSISAWVRVDNFASDNHAIVRNKASSAQKGINFNVGTSGRLNFGVHMQDFQNSVQADDMLKERTWHHVVGTTDGSANTNAYKLYIDGVLVATETPSTSIASIGTFTFDAAIGNRPGSYSLDNFGGQIGEIQLYTDQLTDAEVLQNYNATKHKYTYGLNGFWLPLNNTSIGSIDSSSNLKLHLDASDSSSYGGSGTTWSDLTSNNNDGTISGSPNFLSSTNGGIFDFDGSDDYVTIPHSTNLELSNNGFTAEAWIYHTDSSTNNLLDKGDNGQRVRGYNLQISGNNLDLRMHANNATTATIKILGTKTLTVNAWNHVAFTLTDLSSSAKAITYINGVKDGEDTDNMTSYLANASSDSLLIGSQSGYSQADKFDGKIAQVRIYNKTLTPQEIITNYRATQGNYEQVSTVDISGNANSFTATNIDATDHIKDEPLDNYPTFSFDQSAMTGSNCAYGNGGLTVNNTATSGSAYSRHSGPALPITGKWYWEATYTGDGSGYALFSGIVPENFWYSATGSSMRQFAASYGIYGLEDDGDFWALGTNTLDLTTLNTTDKTAGFAYDADNGDLYIYIGGVAQNSGNAVATGLSGEKKIFAQVAGSTTHSGLIFNFGQNGFTYTPPTGYLSLNTKNIPAPAFDPDGTTPDKPSNYFKAITYQGTGSTQGEDYGYKDGSRAAVFNGTTSRIVIPKITDITGDVTYSTWARLDSSISSSTYRIRFTEINQNGANGYAGILSFMYRPSDGEFLIRAGNGTSSHTSVLTHTYQLETERWYHIAATRNDTTNVTILYINGVAVDTETVSVSASYPSDAQTWIGDLSYSSGLDYNWSGEFDEVRIYSKALNSTEVGYLADDDTSNISTISNLVAYYDMEGDANDESGSATTYNGSLSNVTFTQDKPYGNIDIGFAPDLVWTKSRSNALNHALFDSIRGVTKALRPNAATTEQTRIGVTSFDSNGFSIGSDDESGGQAGYDYVSWAWKAGGKAVENTDGTITSQVSANQDAGFSIVKYTANATSGATIGHGLDQELDLLIVKSTNLGQAWNVYVKDVTDTNSKYLRLNETYSIADLNTVNPRFIPNNFTDSVFSVGNDNATNGISGTDTYIAYCFHSVDGFSKIGSYTGNGLSNGPFVYTGFKPAFVIIKRSDSTGSWIIFDNAREKQNPLEGRLYADLFNSTDIADSSGEINFFSNGFKLDSSVTYSNANAGTYIYMAFAEDPVKYSNGVSTLGDGNEFIQGGNYPEDNFTTTTYTGNGGTQKIVTGYKPDLVWVKKRDGVHDHKLADSVRGATKIIETSTDDTELTAAGSINAFHTNGFSVGSDSSVNGNNNNFVAWSWKAAGNDNTYNILENGTVTSSASASTLGLDTGTITPIKVSANRDNGFSMMNFTGTGTAGDTVPHGLSKPPEFVIAKQYGGADEDWFTWHKDYGISGGEYQWLALNSTTTPVTFNNEAVWNNVAPSNTLFTLNGGGSPNRSGDEHIYYSWHSVPGYSKIGSYEGKSTTNFLYLGFEPTWLMVKRITNTTSDGWMIYDNKRGDADLKLAANSNGTEYSSRDDLDFEVDGVTFKGSYGLSNANGETYIYMAFAHR